VRAARPGAAAGRLVRGKPTRHQDVPNKRFDTARGAGDAGGTQEVAIDPQRQEQPALTDAQVVRRVQLGRRIEAHFGRPHDIEWCLLDDDFQIVQSRPITRLFPLHVGAQEVVS
jgi:phosphoenolpyruvate synthase/pyruvate phosphate dikinase